MNDWPVKFAVSAFLLSLATSMCLSACGYDQSPENNRWRMYRLERVR
jgi:hypothetical protein